MPDSYSKVYMIYLVDFLVSDPFEVEQDHDLVWSGVSFIALWKLFSG